MNNSANVVNKVVLIKRAKRRLLGALTILILIIILSYFFVKNEHEAIRDNDVKISFLDLPISNNEQVKLSNHFVDTDEPVNFKVKTTPTKIKGKEVLLSKDNSTFFIQIGIFSDTNNAKKLQKKISVIGINTKENKVILAGKDKIKLTTDFFSSKKEANSILLKLKNSNLPGIVKEVK
tara:strand:- start:60 stop:593 length:534 start_codon:yes stop_codon:yes gene_type:complete